MMRSVESAPTLPEQHDPLYFKTQAKLIGRAGIDPHEWVEKNAERFSEIFTSDNALRDQLHDQDPDIQRQALVDLEARLAQPDEDTEENI